MPSRKLTVTPQPNVHQRAPNERIMVTAWGETKSLQEWTKDPRAKADWRTIYSRLRGRRTWDPEKAISTPPAVKRIRQSRFQKSRLTIFGETKTLREWASDPRCQVHIETMRRRVKKGVPPELALQKTIAPTYQGSDRAVTAFGETKNIRQWSRDPRCRVSYDTLRQDIAASIAPEIALSRDPREPYLLAAFGEEKTLSEWLRDPRCKVRRTTLSYRIQAGWGLEKALLIEPPAREPQPTYQAFGESKTFEKWLEDPRCQTSQITLAQLLREGMDFEQVLITPSLVTAEPLSAFGETKGFEEWLEDPRCLVGRQALLMRLELGMPLERALTLVLVFDIED